MSDKKDIHDVVIVGGSLSGLLSGVLLKRRGYNVTILEQFHSDIRKSQAAGIGLTDQVRKLFNSAGVSLDDVGPSMKQVHFYDSVNGKLEIKRVEPYPGVMTGWTILFYRLRAHFDRFITPVCPQRAPNASDYPDEGEGVYKTQAKVTSIEYLKSEKVVLVHYDDLSTNTSHTLKTRLLIGADGGNSTIRKLLLPSRPVLRKYAGYMAWRGTLPRNQLSALGKDIYRPGIAPVITNPAVKAYTMTYLIPADDGRFGLDETLVNFVWYDYCSANSPVYVKSMTDVDGKLHRWTLPPGKMDPDAWEAQLGVARKTLPPPLDEMVEKISDRPFITAVSDFIAPECVFHDGHVVLVGEAFCMARPHSGRATNEAARQALHLVDAVEGKITWRQYRTEIRNCVTLNFYYSRMFGLWTLGGRFAQLWAGLQYWWVGSRIRLSERLFGKVIP